ncbi:MAG: glycohydrolase toxin TNT-related protein, partial [Actinomycetota bacterium]
VPALDPITALTGCSSGFFLGNALLGPARLPLLGEVGAELWGYRRTGDLTVHRFLSTYYDPTANAGQGSWIYPPDNGYVIGRDGQPEESQRTLRVSQVVDRYGSEFGSFLAPGGAPYSARSIPPQNLDAAPAAGRQPDSWRPGTAQRDVAGEQRVSHPPALTGRRATRQ